MAYSRRMVERARALRGAGLTVMEITEILSGPGKTSVWRWIKDVRKPAGRAGGGMDLPRLVGDGVSVNIIFTISTNAFSPIAPTRIRRIRQRGCAAFGV